MLISASSEARPFNTVFAPTLAADDLGPRVREVMRGHMTHGRPPVWWIGPSATPADLPEQLVTLGFLPMAAIQLMEAQLTDEAPRLPRVHVRAVRTQEELAEFVGVHQAAYGSAYDTARFTYRVLASLSLTDDAPLQHFLVRAQRAAAAVAVASAFRHDGAAGLYNVAVVPAARGRGYGTAVTWAALADSYARGLRTATLGAEGEAVGMYRRLGFIARGELARVAYAPEMP
ncbi:MAG: GNAT family N-acetyltransferase [Streptomycetaceae bacterium]|nr:GNAT family N-acetyltransferase [Streptomycetaceae bacterium]